MPIVGIVELRRDLLGEVERDALEDDREGARLLDRARIGDDALTLAGSAAATSTLHTVPAHAVDRLRRQADVGHDRDVDGSERGDGVRHGDAALELHRLGAAFLDQAAGVAQRILRAHLVGEERQVADEQRPLPRARHHAAVVDHLVERHRQGRVESLDDHAERVADQDDVDARMVDDATEGKS